MKVQAFAVDAKVQELGHPARVEFVNVFPVMEVLCVPVVMERVRDDQVIVNVIHVKGHRYANGVRATA